LRFTCIDLPEVHSGDCGTWETLSRHGAYVALEAVVAQKGCAAVAAFVDASSGAVAESLILEHTWDSRFDALPAPFVGEALRVTQVEPVTIVGASTARPDWSVVRYFWNGTGAAARPIR
jgi:hypothetical protein